MDYQNQILALSEDLYHKSSEYKQACVKYSEHNFNYQRLLGIRIMQLSNKKPAIEKIIAEALADETKKDFKDFCLHYKGYEYYRALKNGLEAELEAIRTKIMALQSVMKYYGKLDEFGNVV